VDVRAASSPECLRLALAARGAAGRGSRGRNPEGREEGPALAATGAVLFLEKVSPAREQVDSSSGAIGTAIIHAIETCAKIIAEAPVDDEARDGWLERLWEAHQNDEMPHIERLADYWGALGASRDRASAWADRLVGNVEAVWSPHRRRGGCFHGTIACLSELFHAGRHEELIALLDKAPNSLWHYREWGVSAPAAMGRKAEAIRFVEASRGLNDNPIAIARACEDLSIPTTIADGIDARPCRSRKRPGRAGIKRLTLLSGRTFSHAILPSGCGGAGAVAQRFGWAIGVQPSPPDHRSWARAMRSTTVAGQNANSAATVATYAGAASRGDTLRAMSFRVARVFRS
jgi:hypothetical protein